MAALDRLRDALVREQGFQPAAEMPEGFAFLGAKDNYGSVACVALLAADGLGPDALRARAEQFHALVLAGKAHTGHITVRGGRQVALGSFGVLLAVFESGAPDEMVEAARACKSTDLAGKSSSLVWCVDAPLRKVHKHKGLPLAVVPSARSLEAALR